MNHLTSTFQNILLLLLILNLGGIYTASAQIYKTYYHSKHFLKAPHFTAQKLIVVPGSREVAFAGELKDEAPTNDAYGYVLHTDVDGGLVNLHTVKSNAPTATNGIRTSGLAMDKQRRYYLAGSTVQNLSSPGTNTERILSCLETDGKFEWSRMQGFYNFDAVVHDANDQSILTLSGPSGNLAPPDLVLQKFSSSGTLLKGVRIDTDKADQPIELLALAGGKGYIAIGRHDTADTNLPFVIKLDQELNIQWSKVYDMKSEGWEVEDVDVLPDGPIGIAGSIHANLPGQARPFLMTISPSTGEPLWFKSYSLSNSHEARGFALQHGMIFSILQIRDGSWSGDGQKGL